MEAKDDIQNIPLKLFLFSMVIKEIDAMRDNEQADISNHKIRIQPRVHHVPFINDLHNYILQKIVAFYSYNKPWINKL